MTTTTNLSITGVIAISPLGSVAGAMVLYFIGMQLSTERLEKIVDKWGHILRITKADIHRSDKWFEKYGSWTVFFCRLVPLVRSLISIPAGVEDEFLEVFTSYHNRHAHLEYSSG